MLLAESVTLDLKVLLSLITLVMGIGGTLAVLKFRAGRNADDVKSAKNKQKEDRLEQREDGKELANKLDRIAGMVTDQTDILKSKIYESERAQGEKLENFQTKTFARLDSLKEGQAKHETRLTVAETEREHMRGELDRHGRKLTKMPGD